MAGVSSTVQTPPSSYASTSELLGGEQLWSNDTGVGMRTGTGLHIVAQKVSDYAPPVWPGSSLVHFDLDAGADLPRAVQFAQQCGATLAREQSDPRWSVLIDPAGHPFCITTMVP